MSARRVQALGGLCLAAALAAVTVAGVRAGGSGSEVAAVNPELFDLLTSIDFVPGRSSLDKALGDDGAEMLVHIAETDSDPGVRIRAYRALAHYDRPEDEDVRPLIIAALTDAVVEHGAFSRSGVYTLYVRAAMASLAHLARGDAVSTLGPVLAHPSRDVRAATAAALATAGAPEAIPLLRERLEDEPVPQVRLALSDAIRSLTRGD